MGSTPSRVHRRPSCASTLLPPPLSSPPSPYFSLHAPSLTNPSPAPVQGPSPAPLSFPFSSRVVLVRGTVASSSILPLQLTRRPRPRDRHLLLYPSAHPPLLCLTSPR